MTPQPKPQASHGGTVLSVKLRLVKVEELGKVLWLSQISFWHLFGYDFTVRELTGSLSLHLPSNIKHPLKLTFQMTGNSAVDFPLFYVLSLVKLLFSLD